MKTELNKKLEKNLLLFDCVESFKMFEKYKADYKL